MKGTSNAHVKIVVFLTVFLLVLILYLQGQSIIKPSVHAFSWIVTVVSLAIFTWEKWIWHWKIFYFLSNRPDLRGTWKGEVKSLWIDPNTNQPPGTVEVYVVIRQNYSSLDVRLFSTESSSASLSADIVTDGESVHSVAVTYLNTPTISHLPHSPIHHGGMLLNIRGGRLVRQLDGKYWTDRKSIGEISLKEYSPQTADGFDHARGLSFATRQ
jgi:hypothetical protein